VSFFYNEFCGIRARILISLLKLRQDLVPAAIIIYPIIPSSYYNRNASTIAGLNIEYGSYQPNKEDLTPRCHLYLNIEGATTEQLLLEVIAEANHPVLILHAVVAVVVWVIINITQTKLISDTYVNMTGERYACTYLQSTTRISLTSHHRRQKHLLFSNFTPPSSGTNTSERVKLYSFRIGIKG